MTAVRILRSRYYPVEKSSPKWPKVLAAYIHHGLCGAVTEWSRVREVIIRTVAETSGEMPKHSAPSVTNVLLNISEAEKLLVELEAEFCMTDSDGDRRIVNGKDWLKLAKMFLKDSSVMNFGKIKAPKHLQKLLKNVIANLSRPQWKPAPWALPSTEGANLLTAAAEAEVEATTTTTATTSFSEETSAEETTTETTALLSGGNEAATERVRPWGAGARKSEVRGFRGRFFVDLISCICPCKRSRVQRVRSVARKQPLFKRLWRSLTSWLIPVDTLKHVVKQSEKNEGRRRFLARSIEPDADALQSISTFFNALREYQAAAWEETTKKDFEKVGKTGYGWLQLFLVGEFAAFVHHVRREIRSAQSFDISDPDDPIWSETLFNVLARELEEKGPEELSKETLKDLLAVPSAINWTNTTKDEFIEENLKILISIFGDFFRFLSNIPSHFFHNISLAAEILITVKRVDSESTRRPQFGVAPSNL